MFGIFNRDSLAKLEKDMRDVTPRFYPQDTREDKGRQALSAYNNGDISRKACREYLERYTPDRVARFDTLTASDD